MAWFFSYLKYGVIRNTCHVPVNSINGKVNV